MKLKYKFYSIFSKMYSWFNSKIIANFVQAVACVTRGRGDIKKINQQYNSLYSFDVVT